LPSHIFEPLEPIWIKKRETSNRVRGRIETIIAKNVDIDDNEFRNPAKLTKQLREKLPKRPKRKPRHHPALPYAETPQFMPELAGADGRAAQALRFLIFTVCRTNEVLGARWTEIDGHVTVHGFRATFATWAEECTDYPDGVREAALAHKYKNETVAAYQRGAKLEKRRALMTDWANFCAAADKVVALRSA
jgi:integrase